MVLGDSPGTSIMTETQSRSRASPNAGLFRNLLWSMMLASVSRLNPDILWLLFKPWNRRWEDTRDHSEREERTPTPNTIYGCRKAILTLRVEKNW